MKILICGDRNWSDREKIAQQLRIIAKVWWFAGEFTPTVVHGAARGADQIAGEEAKKLGFEVIEYPADWSVGRAGGVIRNQVMLEDSKPDLVLAFHSNIEDSKGTKDMVRRAHQAMVPVEVIT
jgi:ABC-type uncharacterized transport system substrate-binding protein